ncbi:MAG TPA: hypothetical protein VKB63_05830 [Gemmatimonadales bacterium]|nr:hypothetical protein [Gemmatimonadales bacterium]
MPIEFSIDHARRLVTAIARGTLTGQEVFGYQRDTWSRADVQGYNELLDMRAVEHIDLPSVDNMRALAELSATMDAPRTSSKFAIVATSDEAFGLARMYETYRHLEDKSSKQVGVFRTLDEAYAYLGVA